jgi:NAD+ synthase (glutamine-hydrolysing)
LKIALIQTNALIGDIAGNTDRIRQRMADARAAGAQLAVFCEQTIIGYPAKDLLLRRDVIDGNVAALHKLAAETDDIAAIVGFAERTDAELGRPIYNSAALLHRGQVQAIWRKQLLPTYDVFDEARYFEPGRGPQPVVELSGMRIGVTICEDLWSHEEMGGRPLYDADPIGDLQRRGAELVFNISASPFFLGKNEIRQRLLREHATRNGIPLLFVNQVGGNDELLFDGASCIVDASGQVVGQAKTFADNLLLYDTAQPEATRVTDHPEGVALVHDALVLGLRDYLHKCGFQQAHVGLSGGIDSAVVAALAAAALGPENVHCIAMPSRYSSDHSVNDARELAENLGVKFTTIEIEPPHAAFEAALKPHFDDRPEDVTEENVQARCRGVILMAFSNKFRSLVLTTGNKSELAVGYCTLYGDMAGGLAVISDVPKTMVYELARHVNERAGREIIPDNIITKPPSAELKPDQVDQDSLPAYDVLDEILERYEVQLQSLEEIIAAGFDEAVVRDVVRKFQVNEYKRQQAAPGLKVTSRAFGFGRRMPIAARHPR